MQFFVNGIIIVYLAYSVLLKHLVSFFAGEGRFSCCQYMENNPYAKYVAHWVVPFSTAPQIGNFWSHVPWRTTASVYIILSISVGGQAKIPYHTLPIIIISEHDVLRLKIPMHNSFLVHEGNPLHD